MCYYLCSEALNPSEESEDCAFYRLFFLLLAFYYLYLHLTMAYSILLKWVMNCSSSNCIMPVLYQYCLLISILHFFFWKHPNILLPSFSQSNSCFLSPIVIVWTIRGFPPNRPTQTVLLAGMTVQKGPKKCGGWWSRYLRESCMWGFPPAVFRKGLVNVLWLLLHCVQPHHLSFPQKKKKRIPQASQPLMALIWI